MTNVNYVSILQPQYFDTVDWVMVGLPLCNKPSVLICDRVGMWALQTPNTQFYGSQP